MLHAYNALGERTTTALARSAVDPAAIRAIDYTTDRVSVTESAPGIYNGQSVIATTTRIFATEGLATPTVVATSGRTPDGLSSWSSSSAATLGINFCDGWPNPQVADGTADGFSAWKDAPAEGDLRETPVIQNEAVAIGGGVSATWAASNLWAAGDEESNETALYREYLDDSETTPESGIGVRVTLSGLADWLTANGLSSYRIRLYASTDYGTDFQSVAIRPGADPSAAPLDLVRIPVLGTGGFPAVVASPGGGPGEIRGYADSAAHLTANTITLTIPPRNGGIRGTLCAIKIVGFRTDSNTTATVGLARTETTIRADGSKSTTTYAGGRPQTVANLSADNVAISSVTYGYEDSTNGIPGRLRTTTDSRTGTTTTSYVSTTCDAVATVTDSGSRITAFKYDSHGNRTEVNAPDTKDATGADLLNVTTTGYDSYGRVQSVTGGQTYPVSRTYDYAGRLKTMTTDGGVVTFWQYSEITGLLTGKFQDYKAGNLADGPTYAHTPAGRLQTRT